MIIVRSPFRIPLAGGGTDLDFYYRKRGGDLISATIDQYIYIFKYHMNPLEKNEYLKLYLKNSKQNKFHFFTREYFLNYFISNGH